MEVINPTRRGFLGLLASAFAAPVIVKASSLMPVKRVIEPVDYAKLLARAVNETKNEMVAKVLNNAFSRDTTNAIRAALEPGLCEVFGLDYKEYKLGFEVKSPLGFAT